jgi:N6-L-threonylcarbamoyladenine synthase
LEYGALAEPLLALVVSGGHTSLVLTGPEGGFTTVGATMDDAAGEAFDKVGRFMGLAYPGGPAIDRLARDGDPTAVGFPRPTVDGADFDFSMSGLKTAVTRELRRRQARGEPLALADVAASFQEAAVETQVATTLAAARAHGVGQVAVVGGVAANSRLRASMSDACQRAGLGLVLPSPTLCTDNGAMIAAAGSNHLAAGEVSALDVDVAPGAELTGEPA